MPKQELETHPSSMRQKRMSHRIVKIDEATVPLSVLNSVLLSFHALTYRVTSLIRFTGIELGEMKENAVRGRDLRSNPHRQKLLKKKVSRSLRVRYSANQGLLNTTLRDGLIAEKAISDLIENSSSNKPISIQPYVSDTGEMTQDVSSLGASATSQDERIDMNDQKIIEEIRGIIGNPKVPSYIRNELNFILEASIDDMLGDPDALPETKDLLIRAKDASIDEMLGFTGNLDYPGPTPRELQLVLDGEYHTIDKNRLMLMRAFRYKMTHSIHAKINISRKFISGRY